jgi:hypothetical protein
MRAERFEPASTPEVRFTETAAGLPAAIRATTQGTNPIEVRRDARAATRQ